MSTTRLESLRPLALLVSIPLNASKVHSDKQSRAFFVEGLTKTRVEFVSVFMPD